MVTANLAKRLEPRRRKRRRQTLLYPRRRPMTPTLRFTPTAWAKLLFLRDRGETEVGGFGISSPLDLLLIDDVRLIRQNCTSVTVAFDDQSVADFFDRQVDHGFRPEQFGRVWIHTHPGDSASPSYKDEETFARCFGESDWAVMFILAQGGDTYARLRFNIGPRASLEIPVDVDYRRPFAAADQLAWDREYVECVHPLHLTSHHPLHDPLQVEQPHLYEIETEDDWQDWFNLADPEPFATMREELLYAPS